MDRETGNDRMEELHMKKKKRIFPIILLLLAAAVTAAGIYFYPSWQAAKVLEENMDLAHFSYELEVELDREALGSEQAKLLGTLAGLTGVQEEALYRIRIQGSVWEEKIYALIYPDGAAEPFVELYLGEEADVINEAMLYNIIRSNLLGQNALLNFLVPVQGESVYMTLEQVEQMFGVDLSGIRSFSLPAAEDRLSVWQCFIALAAMSREKQADGTNFALDKEQMQVRLGVSAAEKSAPLKLELSIEEPEQVMAEYADFLAELGLEMPGEEIEMLRSISLRAVPGEGAELVMPAEYVSQDIIDLIARIRELFNVSGERQPFSENF